MADLSGEDMSMSRLSHAERQNVVGLKQSTIERILARLQIPLACPVDPDAWKQHVIHEAMVRVFHADYPMALRVLFAYPLVVAPADRSADLMAAVLGIASDWQRESPSAWTPETMDALRRQGCAWGLLEPQLWATIFEGLAYEGQGRDDRALQLYLSATRPRPESERFAYLKVSAARILAGRGQAQEAWALLRECKSQVEGMEPFGQARWLQAAGLAWGFGGAFDKGVKALRDAEEIALWFPNVMIAASIERSAAELCLRHGKDVWADAAAARAGSLYASLGMVDRAMAVLNQVKGRLASLATNGHRKTDEEGGDSFVDYARRAPVAVEVGVW